MNTTATREIRISNLEKLKRSADGNIKRIKKLISDGFQTRTTPERWIKLSQQYEKEINQLKQL